MSDAPQAPINFGWVKPDTTYQNFYLHAPATADMIAVSEDGEDEPLETRRVDAAVQKEGCEANTTGYFRWKAGVDLVVVVSLMLIAVPIMACVAVVVLIAQGRPVFYRQTRVGMDGRTFRIVKFRSMRRDAERATGATWSGSDDPRVTTMGRWMRCSHVDELPQLWNILVGDMSLVGPRPERPEFVCELSRELPSYTDRLQVRPGITGLAQLGLGYDQSVSDVEKKVELDIFYINTASLGLDLKLLLATVPYIVTKLLRKWQMNRRHRKCEAVTVGELVTAKTVVGANKIAASRQRADAIGTHNQTTLQNVG